MTLRNFSFSLAALAVFAFTTGTVRAGLKLPAIVGDNMVLQRDLELPIWGWANPGAMVSVEIAGQNLAGAADENGRWEVKLKPLSISDHALRMTIRAGDETRVLTNILVGEVWLCSGQSNMQWPLGSAYDADLEIATANFPNMRLITVPQTGTQELQDDFDGRWEPVTPETAPDFTAVGYLFGRQLHQTLGVPVGLIDNAWGGSAAEAWVRRDVLEQDGRFNDYLEEWKRTEATYDHDATLAKWKTAMEAWKKNADKLKAEGKPAPNPPRQPQNPLTGQHRPGNLFAGVLHPVLGYGIRGAIWYQGETNAPRGWNYRDLFPKMIGHWREEWGQGDFPFYWVQLADFKAENPEPGDSDWAELRESQTLTQDLIPNGGQAVIYDIGEGRDIHPRDKQNVARRLARLALAKDYGMAIPADSPRFEKLEIAGNKAVLTFRDVGSQLYAFDETEPKGFAIAGEDRKWVWATAKIVGRDKVEVSSDAVPAPVAVRYAWADNPVATLESREGLPVTPFRTDDWPLITGPQPEAAAPAENAKPQ
ncbi:MAG: sialate O-acetylesterase [Verrucomicrobiae bacterium]|nr:sialate O-acetylesterase [Verrucomicrobiae bacterium]